MDPLSDVLGVVHLRGAYLFTLEATAPWSVTALPALEVAPQIMLDAEHLISYHVLVEGRCWAGLDQESQEEIVPGDAIVLPHGDGHFLSSHRGKRVDPGPFRMATPLPHPGVARVGVGPCDARLVCGFLECDALPFNPLLAALPRFLHLPRIADGWLASFPRHAVQEAHARRAGSSTVLTRMADLMFIEVLRRHIETLGEGKTGWLAALHDPIVGPALSRLHERPAHDWSLVQLARSVAVSRTVLAERFARLVGMPPIRYLAQWRLQLAADLLARGSLKVAAVGAEVGYESEAAFSRAFKRGTGMSPAAWRRKRCGAKDQP